MALIFDAAAPKTAINAALSRHKTEQPAFFLRRQARSFFPRLTQP